MSSKDVPAPVDVHDHGHSSRSAIKEIGKILLSLLRGSSPARMYQTISGLPVLSDIQRRLSPQGPGIKDPMFLAEARRWMKFASGTYGWKLQQAFVGDASSPEKLKQWVAGLRKSVSDDEVNMRLLCDFTGVPREDWLVTQWGSADILRPAHCVGIDRRVGAIVFAIRGTMSISDTVTDLAATPGPLFDGYGHRGIIDCARFLAQQYTDLLRRTLASNPDLNRIVITGHSLGAGTASILALLLHTAGLPIQCFAFAPPPVLSPGLAAQCKPFLNSFVFRDDLVPRLSLAALYDLRDRAANASLSTQSTVAAALPGPVRGMVSGAHNLMLRIFGAKEVPIRHGPPEDTLPLPPAPVKPTGPIVRGEYGVPISVPAAAVAEAAAAVDAGPSVSSKLDDAETEAAMAEMMEAVTLGVEQKPLLNFDEVAAPAAAVLAPEAAAAAAPTGPVSTKTDVEIWGEHPDEAPPMYVPGVVHFIQQNMALTEFVMMHTVDSAQVWRVVLGDTMFVDHLPGMYEKALDRLFVAHSPVKQLQPWQPGGVPTELSVLSPADDLLASVPAVLADAKFF